MTDNPRLKFDERPDGLWIVDTNGELDDHGPYDTKGEAEEDFRGIAQFLKANP